MKNPATNTKVQIKDKLEKKETTSEEVQLRSRNQSKPLLQSQTQTAATDSKYQKQQQNVSKTVDQSGGSPTKSPDRQLKSILKKPLDQIKPEQVQETIKLTKTIEDVNVNQSSVQQPDNTGQDEKIRVAIRVRPVMQKELAKEIVVYCSKSGKGIRVTDNAHMVESRYDKVYGRDSKQGEIYEFVQGCVSNVLLGFNCTIFAYGQTGSGKTHTMFGEGYDDLLLSKAASQMVKIDSFSKIRNSLPDSSTFSSFTNMPTAEKTGIIPRCVADLFLQIKKQDLQVTVYCSFLQIYNEKLFDLLQDTHSKNPLQIREEKLQGIYVEGLSEYVVQNEHDCMALLKRGERNRIKRSTKMNMQSSRSHSLFQFLIESDQVDANGMLKRSKLNLGDLAGSEKINKEEEMQAKHMLELRNINLSLTSLGKVIQLLSKSDTPGSHVPFRESKLTRLLQDSIGGNTQTYLIATIAPTIESIDETISTLKFADRAKCVMQRVKKNEYDAKDDAIVQKLQKEVQHLKELLNLKRKGNPADMSRQLYVLKDENERLRQMASGYSDIERMKMENKQMRLELQRYKATMSENTSAYNGDISPSSAALQRNGSVTDDNTLSIFKNSMQKRDKTIEPNSQGHRLLSQDDNITPNYDSDESQQIQQQFKNYKSEAHFVIKSDTKQSKNAGTTPSSLYSARQLPSNMHGPNDFNTPVQLRKGHQILEKHYLHQQKQRLQKVIQDQHQQRTIGTEEYKTESQQKSFDKRYKYTAESADEATKAVLSLPAIKESTDFSQALNSHGNVSGNFSRKTSNQLRSDKTVHSEKKGSSYIFNQVSPLQRSQDSRIHLNDFTKSNIQKYPRNATNVRMSVEQQVATGVPVEVNRSYQVSSSGYIGQTTQSSLYGANSLTYDDQAQTKVRIRGKNNQLFETSGSLVRTLDEQRQIEQRRAQMRRSNERLRMLEDMEKQRQVKMEQEIEKLNFEKRQREEEQQRKKEILKTRRLVEAKTDKMRSPLAIK